MGARRDDCRFCGEVVSRLVRTENGVSRTCAEHVGLVPNPVRISELRGVTTGRLTVVPSSEKESTP